MSTKNSSFFAEEIPHWEIGGRGRKKDKEEEGTNSQKNPPKPKKKIFRHTQANRFPPQKKGKETGGKYDTSRHLPHIKMMFIASFSRKNIFLLLSGGGRKNVFFFPFSVSPPLLLASHQTCIFGVIFVAKKQTGMGKTRKTRNNSGNALFSFKARYFWVAPTHWNFPPKNEAIICADSTLLKGRKGGNNKHIISPKFPGRKREKIGPHNHQPSDQPGNCAM